MKTKTTFDSMSLSFRLLTGLLCIILLTACNSQDNDSKQEPEPEAETVAVTLNPADVNATNIYIPNELQSNDFYTSTSTWYYGRSQQSEHFIVFWGAGYGTRNPNDTAVPAAYRVDINDLLTKAEQFYTMNITQLKFAETGVGKSNLDNYKMLIFLYYQQEWLATGSGYDDVIGALWVNPATCRPVGAVIGHEIGHSFQYQVFCDLKGTSGFRYGFGGNGGNTFWEQTAQWQAYQSYPQEAFTSSNFNVYTQNYNRHICHEEQRYASYFIHYYWANKHGRDIVGKIWRGAKSPEDPIQAYMRLTNISVAQLNDEIYDAATKFVTWDLDALRANGQEYIGKQTFNYTRLTDGSYQVAYNRCPGTTGYNVIPLNVPAAGTQLSAAFTGMVNAAGYNTVANAQRAGWRYGYVALLQNGTRVYSNMYSNTTGTAAFTVPQNCSKLWFVVTGAPNTYLPHPWDDNQANDDQWPYKVKFTNTDLLGSIVFDGTETPKNLTLSYNVNFPFSATAYTGKTVSLSQNDLVLLAKAFVLQPGEITSALGTKIKFYGVESNGTLNATTTANGYGHWFNASGNVSPWGSAARVYSEFDQSGFKFTTGQFPNQCTPGTVYTVKQALVYEHQPGQKVQATFEFVITVQ